jgi:hypothetical protein
MATVLTGGSVRARTGGGRAAPTSRKRNQIHEVYERTIPRGATATGAHGVYPGTGHVAKLTRISHPAAVQDVRTAHARKGRGPIPLPGQRPPVRRGPVSRPPTARGPKIRPPIVGGEVIEVGGFVQQENAGGTTSGVGGGSVARAATGGYFATLRDQGGIGGLSWMQLAEGAAVVFAAALLWRATARKGRR